MTRWLYILAGRPLDFWRNVSWDLERVNLVTLVQSKLTSSCNRALTEMETAYFEGIPNPYSQQIPDGRERTLQALTFLQTHHVFPCPPAFLCHPNGMMSSIRTSKCSGRGASDLAVTVKLSSAF
jgi:hypothetical protein